MRILKLLSVGAMAMGLLLTPLAAQAIDDPVIKARGEKALSQGVSDTDLPPVPRAIAEPPPLPPPETHIKDTRGYRPSKASRASARKGKKGHAAKAGSKASKSSKRAKSGSKSKGKSSRRKKK